MNDFILRNVEADSPLYLVDPEQGTYSPDKDKAKAFTTRQEAESVATFDECAEQR